jgi:hypothetical protein
MIHCVCPELPAPDVIFVALLGGTSTCAYGVGATAGESYRQATHLTIMKGRLPMTSTAASCVCIVMAVPNRLWALYSVVPSAYTAGHSKQSIRRLIPTVTVRERLEQMSLAEPWRYEHPPWRIGVCHRCSLLVLSVHPSGHCKQCQPMYGAVRLSRPSTPLGCAGNVTQHKTQHWRTCCWRHDLAVQRHNNLIAVLVPVEV